jgi:putative DNA primase/helicase
MLNTRTLDAATVKASIDPGAFYAAEFPRWKPKRAETWNEGPLCPFHADTKPGSFRVHTGTGQFVCYSCGARGQDIIAYAQRRLALSFQDALQALCDTWGIHA